MDLSHYTPMQQYYLERQLPEFVTRKEVQPQKKDHYYYSGMTNNIWNNPTRIAKKGIYQRQLSEGNQMLSKLKNKEIMDQLLLQEMTKEEVIWRKQTDRERLDSRKQERLGLQMESQQDVTEMSYQHGLAITMDGHNTQSKTLDRESYIPLTGRAPNSWNQLNQACKKYVEQTINPRIVKKDEDALLLIQKRIDKDEDVEYLRQQSFDQRRAHTRSAFLRRHSRNIEFETKCGLIPEEKPLVIFQTQLTKNHSFQNFPQKWSSLPKQSDNILSQRNTDQKDQKGSNDKDDNILIHYNNKQNQQSKQHVNPIYGDELESTKKIGEQQFEKERKFLTSAQSQHSKKSVNFNPPSYSERIQETPFFLKNLESLSKNQMSQTSSKQKIVDDRLSQPKRKEFKPRDFRDKQEFKGLLAAELNSANIETDFAKTIICNSSIANATRPPPTRSSLSNISSIQTYLFSRASTTKSGQRSTILKNPRIQEDFKECSILPPTQLGTITPINHPLRICSETSQNIKFKQDLLSEIDVFEKTFQLVKDNRVGFSRVNLAKFQQKETFVSTKSALGKK